MFSRVATTVARAPLRATVTRRLSSSAAAAAVSSQASSSFRLAGAAMVAVAGGLAVANHKQESSPAMCATARVSYTGLPGTCKERSFIVSALWGAVVVCV